MNGWRTALGAAAIVFCVLSVARPAEVAAADDPEVLLESARHKALVDGDLRAAIEVCEKIVAQPNGDRAVAAQALVHIGRCYEKLGKTEARKAYERVVREYADQAEAVSAANARLALLKRESESEEPARVELQEVWSFPGLDELDVLDISRDGRYCVFLAPETDGLVVRDLTTGKETHVAETRPSASRPYWLDAQASISPDNKWLAYVGGDSEAGYDLRIVGIDGSGDRVLHANEEKSDIYSVQCSPDGRHVLVGLYDTGGERIDWPARSQSAPVRIAAIAVADGSTSVLKTLTPEEHLCPALRFSPDGRYVAYGRMMDPQSKQEDLFLIPLDGGPEIPLVEHPADDDLLGWLPDGETLLIRSNRRRWYQNDLWMIQVVDGKPLGSPRLVQEEVPRGISNEERLWGPVRTPTEGWAFYCRYTQWGQSSPSVHVATLDPETGKLLTAPEQITQPTAGREEALSPDFSRDGKYLAYYVAPAAERTHEGWRCPPGNIVIRSLETGQEREITLSPKLSVWGRGRLRWAPDGRSILAQSRVETGYQGIFRADIETGRLDPVVTRPTLNWQQPTRAAWEFVARGEWSPDGKTVFYIRGRNDPTKGLLAEALVARDRETGREREVYRDPEGEFEVVAAVGALHAVSPDGQRVVIGDKKSLKILPTTGGKARELLKWENRAASAIAWTPDGRFLLCVRTYQGRSELWRIAAEGGDPERVDEFRAVLGTVYTLRVHPDGRQIAFVSRPRIPQYRIRMLQIVVSDEMAQEMCKANLRRIGKAIRQYKSDHGDVPDWLSDLYPDYLQDKWLLVCPADSRAGNPSQFSHPRDPKMRCSYGYLFSSDVPSFPRLSALPAAFPPRKSMTCKDVRKLQMEYYGPVVPVARCRHPNWSSLSLLGYDGEVYETDKGFWESSPQAKAGLLSRLRSAMQSEPATWVQRYDTQRFACVLKDETALTKLLKTHLKDHPEDEAVREFLAELPRLRFSHGSRDDAEENVDDGSVDQWDNFELIHDTDDDKDQVVGIRVPDIPVPQGTRVKRAYLQFTALTDDAGAEQTDLVLHAELAANAEPFAEVKHNITSRRKTAASVKWSPEPWSVAGERSEKQRTPDLSSLIQEVVNQPDWKKGNALVLIISGSGRRRAESCDGGWSGTPMLYVEH